MGFREDLKDGIKIDDIEEMRKYFLKDNEQNRPSIGEIVNGYKGFIDDFGEGFVYLLESYNRSVEIAKKIVGDAKMKARIKDFSSSKTNTDKKILDDIFGFEIVTPTEEGKEFFMLFNHLVFSIINDKKYDKNNGYVAYHCTADKKKNKPENIKELVYDIIENSKTKKRKISIVDEPMQTGKKDLDFIFTILKDIKNNDSKKMRKMIETLEEMISEFYSEDFNRDALPFIEFHFCTYDVEERAIRGSASHTNYKKTNETLIKNFFRDGRLFRGINSPWKFESVGGKIVLQDFYKTLKENWPFLEDEIIAKTKKGTNSIDEIRNRKFDNLLGIQFPFLRKYIEAEDKEYSEDEKKEQWGVLKAIMIANRINFDSHENEPGSLTETFINEVNQIWE